MKKNKILVITIVTAMLMSACTMKTKEKAEIPETKYTEIGHAVKNEVLEDGTVRTTYALLGLKDEKINYLSLDQMEQNPKKDRHLFTNKELESAYGLSYKSEFGEWSAQINALQNYIVGKQMTLDDIKNIKTYKKDNDNTMVPDPESDLGAAVGIDIKIFIDLIEEAFNNTTQVEATRIASGENVRLNVENNQVDTTIVFVATDYRYKICYSYMDRYSTKCLPDADIRSMKEKAHDDDRVKEWVNQLEGYEEYIQGLNMLEAYGVETYDKGDGINTNVPKINTDLGKICDIDLSEYIIVLKEAAGRL